MSQQLAPSDRAEFETIVAHLQGAWNAGDGAAFAVPFAADADFVNIRAEHMRGRDVIAAGHAGIFSTIYAGSSNQYTLESARTLANDVVVLHVRSILDAPQGPLKGRHSALFSMVMTKPAGKWEIAAFHNTLQPPPR